MEGVKYDHGKTDWSLMPWRELDVVAKVLTYGSTKYEPDNWKRVPRQKSRYLAAFVRHLVARILGQENDDETGLPHMAHAICCMLFFFWGDNECRLQGKPLEEVHDKEKWISAVNSILGDSSLPSPSLSGSSVSSGSAPRVGSILTPGPRYVPQ